MARNPLFLAAFALLVAVACAPAEDTRGEPSAAPDPAEGTTASSADLARARPVEHFAPAPDRDLADYVPGCQGMNPDRRPRGSNCYGIFPEQCGADHAAAFVGQRLTPSIRESIIGYSPGGDVRFIRPGDAVIEDLRFGRLNILLGNADRIESVDCY